MRKAVRILARQQMPNYRKPASFLIKESYPLPPYSTIIGLVHKMCEWNRYHPMQVSVQGKFASTVSDYATNYAFGAIPLDRAQLKVDCGSGKEAGIARVPRSYELLTDVILLLHILPEDESLVDSVFEAFSNPPIYPSLGRYEDLLQIETVESVVLSEAPQTFSVDYDAYVPLDSIDSFYSQNITGTIYRLGKVFEYDNGKKQISTPDAKSRRVWKETVTVRHICAKTELFGTESTLFDQENKEAVFPA